MGGSLKNLLRTQVVNRLKKRGYSSYGANSLFNAWYDDFLKEKKATLAQKLWAYRRGFLSDKIALFGLNEKNFRHYLSDFDYMRLHPINGSYSKWIDDKLTMRYILAPYNDFLPEYYFHIYNREILRLIDCPGSIEPSIQGVLRLLEEKGSLACKLKSGSMGKGFHKLACSGQDTQINNQPSSRGEVEALLSTWLKSGTEERIITEYIQAHPDLDRIYPDAPASLRLMLIREKSQAARMIFGVLSFPTRATGILSNQEDDWVACIVNIQTGELAEGQSGHNGLVAPCPCHPDTHVPIAGILPNWSLIAEKISEICAYLPQLRYMGFDIIVTGDSFKITEINSHAYINLLQLEHPLLTDEVARDFFNQLLAEVRGGGR